MADFQPTASWTMLRRRAELLAEVRTFFASRGFLEVETSLLSRDTVVDRHIDPMVVAGQGGEPPRYLQTSPEFAMKRLLAAGGKAIYQVARAFRAGERGALHNPEFTLVEWYRVGDTYEEAQLLLSELAEAALARGPAERLTYAEAFEREFGFNPHSCGMRELQAAAAKYVPGSPDFHSDRDAWLDLLLSHVIQPMLGTSQPTILYDYPASQAALACVRLGPANGDPVVAERFELFVDGIELANGYHELLDPTELRRRNSEANEVRRANELSSLPEESRLLAAMEAGLPPCCGVALGFDRLVMVAAGARSIDEVLPFPWERA